MLAAVTQVIEVSHQMPFVHKHNQQLAAVIHTVAIQWVSGPHSIHYNSVMYIGVMQVAVQSGCSTSGSVRWPRLFAKQAGQGGEGSGDSSGEASSSGDEAGAGSAAGPSSDAEPASMDVAELQEMLAKAQEEVR